MPLRVLSRRDVEAAIDIGAALDAVRSAFAQLSDGRASVPLRVSQPSPEGTTLLMPAWLPEPGALSVKIVSVFPHNRAKGRPSVRAASLLLDPVSGEPRALLDAGWLTALRTGAAGALAADLLARPDAEVVALFGAGVQARAQLAALRTVRRIREVRILSRGDSARRLAEELEQEPDAPAVTLPLDAAGAARGADIVVAATDSATPVFPGRAIDAGTHVTGIGSYRPDMREVDRDLVARARVIVDSREAALREAGELVDATGAGVLDPTSVDELGEILSGARPGRRAADEVTFFKAVGNAAQDAAVATRVLEEAEARRLGTLVDFD